MPQNNQKIVARSRNNDVFWHNKSVLEGLMVDVKVSGERNGYKWLELNINRFLLKRFLLQSFFSVHYNVSGLISADLSHCVVTHHVFPIMTQLENMLWDLYCELWNLSAVKNAQVRVIWKQCSAAKATHSSKGTVSCFNVCVCVAKIMSGLRAQACNIDITP